MPSNKLQELEREIGTLTPQELEELCAWFERYQHPFDLRLESDLAAGGLDSAIEQALNDEEHGRVQPL